MALRFIVGSIATILIVSLPITLGEVLLLAAEDELWTVETKTGELDLIGTLPVAGETVLELALSPDGGLYGMAGGSLYQIDPVRADATLIGAVDTTATVSGLAFTPDGTLYGLQWNNRLYEIDPQTADAVFLGQVGIPTATHTLDADASGKLYAPTYNPLESDNFWQIDLDTLEADFVSPAPAEISAMVFGSDNVLYAVGGSAPSLYEVDLAEGEWRELFTLETLSEVEGMEVIPEPATLLILLVASNLVCWRRKYTRHRHHSA